MKRLPSRRGWGPVRVVALGGLAIACSTVPPPVVSPVPRAPLGQALTWSVDWGFARAHLQRPDGSTQAISGNGDNGWGTASADGTALELPIPALLSFHQWSGDWDTGEYAGWRRLGVTARRRLATAAGGAATSLVGALNAHWSFKGLDGGLALEQTIPLGAGVAALLRAGASYGLRDYDLEVPADLDPSAGHDNTIGDAHFDILRADLRIEPAVGAILGGGAVVVSFQPYFVVARGAIDAADCQGCVAGVRLLDFTQDRGLAVAVTWVSP
ncbi:MAG TPA: hypothetical protein VHO06_14275 [Polyangia bacterium]|nr:hypothetical protein [Polyangia bacterium]